MTCPFEAVFMQSGHNNIYDLIIFMPDMHFGNNPANRSKDKNNLQVG